MSFSDRPSVPTHRKVMCILYIVASAPIFSVSLMTGMIGQCDSSGCMPLGYFLVLFPGLMIALIVGGLCVARWAVKDDI